MELEEIQQIILNYISENEIFLYCTPKCGGSSLLDSLKKYYKTIHIHSKSFFEKFYTDNKIIDKKFNIFDCIDKSSRINDEIYIIDVYRRPVERNMSYFFQIIDILIPNYKEKTTEQLVDFFNKNKYFDYYQSIDEVANYYGINLYETPFDHEKMYLEYKFKNINFIILHFDYTKKWNVILKTIFKKKKKIIIENRNIGNEKEYADIYTDYKIKYKIPKFILDFIENEKHFNYFNKEETKKNYINLWRKRIDDKIIDTELPNDFNLNSYKEKNIDLQRMNDLELIWHFLLFGKNEKREY